MGVLSDHSEGVIMGVCIKCNTMDIKALTVYFELGLVDPSLHHAYIEAEYGKEDKFWSALERLAIDLPYINFSSVA